MIHLNNAISPKDSLEIEQAISYLIEHFQASGHNLKPVILHSIRVASLLLEMGYDQKIIIGAILHDILEDTNVTEDVLRKDFGGDICKLVSSVTYTNTISDPVDRYKEMFERTVSYGRAAVVLKSVDIATNSLYIDLVSDMNKRKELVEKGTYFLNLTKFFSDEPAWQILAVRNREEIKKIS